METVRVSEWTNSSCSPESREHSCRWSCRSLETAIAGKNGVLSSDLDGKNGKDSETLIFHTTRHMEILLLLIKVNHEYSLEGLMLKLKFQYSGHLKREELAH